MENDNSITKQFISEIGLLKKMIKEFETSEINFNKTENALKESEEKYNALVDTVPFGVLVLNRAGIITFCNRRIIKFAGSPKEEIIGKHFTNLSFINAEDMPNYLKIFSYALNGKRGVPVEITSLDRKGNIFNGEMRYSLLKEDGKVKSIQVTITDITNRKKAEKEIVYLRFYDSLTGLHNRAYFLEEIKRLDTERQLPLGFLIGDINGLKIINDTFGNDSGDKALIDVAKIIKRCCRSEDIIARWGEDEFTVLLPKTSNEYLKGIIKRIKAMCARNINKKSSFVFSMGSAVKENMTQDFKNIIRESEEEMYDNKKTEGKIISESSVLSIVKSLLETSLETKEHGKRIRMMVMNMGKVLKLSPGKLKELSILSDIHDLGKIALPDDISSKNGGLNQDDWDIIRKFPEIGSNIAKSSAKFSHLANYIYTHHERWDGTGYPRGLKGEEIPIISRIMAIADAYDVMRTGRSYKKVKDQSQAVEELRRCRGGQFDPGLVEKFIDYVINRQKTIASMK